MNTQTPEQKIAQLEARIKEYEQLLWLAAEIRLFFSHYNIAAKQFDDGAYPELNCIAKDARPLKEKYGLSGIVAWAAKKRGKHAPEELQDDKYRAAPEGATYEDGDPITQPVNIAWRDCASGEVFAIEYNVPFKSS